MLMWICSNPWVQEMSVQGIVGSITTGISELDIPDNTLQLEQGFCQQLLHVKKAYSVVLQIVLLSEMLCSRRITALGGAMGRQEKGCGTGRVSSFL